MPPRLLLPSALRFIDPSTRSRGPDVPQHPVPAPPSFRRPSRPAASVDWLCSGLFRFLIRLWSVRTARVHRTYMTPTPHPSDSRVLRVGVWFHHRVVPAQVGAHRRLVWVPLRLTILALNVSSKKDQLFKSCCVCSPLSRTPPRQHHTSTDDKKLLNLVPSSSLLSRQRLSRQVTRACSRQLQFLSETQDCANASCSEARLQSRAPKTKIPR